MDDLGIGALRHKDLRIGRNDLVKRADQIPGRYRFPSRRSGWLEEGIEGDGTLRSSKNRGSLDLQVVREARGEQFSFDV